MNISFCVADKSDQSDWQFPAKNYSAEDRLDGTIGCSSGIPAVPPNRELSEFCSEPFPRGKNAQNSVPWTK
jgi:hypothetical protein